MIKATINATRVLLHGLLRSGDPSPVQMDNTSHGLIAVTHEHNKLHEGDAFRYTDSVTLAAAGVQDYLLTVADNTKWPHFQFTVDGTAVTTVQVYRGTDKTGTTLQSTFNADENSTTVAGLTVHKGVSGGTTDGTLIYTYSSGTSSGAAKSSGIGAAAEERILKQNTKYIIRVTSGTNGNLTNMHMEWYEHIRLTP